MPSDLFTKRFWIEVGERAIKTSAQTVIGAGILGEGADLFALDFGLVVSFGATGALLSVLTSVASITVGPRGSASTVHEWR